MWQGRWADAATSFDQAAEQHPGDWEAQYRLGQCYMEMGDPLKASQSLAIAASLRPLNNRISNLYSSSLFLSGQEDQLFTYLHNRARKLQTSAAWTTFAEFAILLEDPDSATNALDTAIALNDGTFILPYIIAATYAEQLGDDNLAVQRWQEAWMIEPTNGIVNDALRAHGVVPGPTMTGVDEGLE